MLPAPAEVTVKRANLLDEITGPIAVVEPTVQAVVVPTLAQFALSSDT